MRQVPPQRSGPVPMPAPDSPTKPERPERPSHTAWGHLKGAASKIGYLKVLAGVAAALVGGGGAAALYTANHATKDYVRAQIDESVDVHTQIGHADVRKDVGQLGRDVAALKVDVNATKRLLDRVDERQVRIEEKIDRLVDDPSPRRRRAP